MLQEQKTGETVQLPRTLFSFFYFFENGARPHTSKQAMKFLKKRCRVLESWPPNSPDLNPIEHLWGIMDKKLENNRPF